MVLSSNRNKAPETHEASKFSTEVIFISLLPCPADQFSSTLKSVHWNFVDPRLPEQPLRQVISPKSPIKVPADTMLALQKVSDEKSVRQAIRWVTKIYQYNKKIHWVYCIIDVVLATICNTAELCLTLEFLHFVAAALSQHSIIYTHPAIKVDWINWLPLNDGPSEVRGCSQLQNYNHQGKEKWLVRDRHDYHRVYSSVDVLSTRVSLVIPVLVHGGACRFWLYIHWIMYAGGKHCIVSL